MNWDNELDDDSFFDPVDDDDDDDEYYDGRISFATAASASACASPMAATATAAAAAMYDIWMAEPGSIQDRRKRLLQGMGLADNKDLLRLASLGLSKKRTPRSSSQSQHGSQSQPTTTSTVPSSLPSIIVRSKSDGAAAAHKQLTRSSSAPLPSLSSSPGKQTAKDDKGLVFTTSPSPVSTSLASTEADGDTSPQAFFFKIKNLNNGKEFIVNDFREDGMWNRLSEVQTGRLLTMEEFERCVGYSPIVKELMRRENVEMDDQPDSAVSSIGKTGGGLTVSKSKKKGGGPGGWLKNIKVVANSVAGHSSRVFDRRSLGESWRFDKSMRCDQQQQQQQQESIFQRRLKVRQHGKAWKELTGLYMSQEIQAHEGSIWSIKFSLDGRYLASAGEDRVIHVWEVIETERSHKPEDDAVVAASPDRYSFSSSSSERKRRGSARGGPLLPVPVNNSSSSSSSSRKGSNALSDYLVFPDTLFSLSTKPTCSFQGHLDDVLDLSWSKSQYLLSSSMDKTVRLWDLSTKACLKLFAHNDYVTCIQFNPVDDRYFISGSLDAKVRIWNVPDRQVVDWSDLHEMVTAACYTPDGQGAFVGSHKGNCRLYSTTDCKLQQKSQIDVQNKKKKSHARKITGFQFAPGNPSEVLITSADSQIRIFDGVDLVHKFKGFRNTSSQISASFSSDGKYVVCASEDSHVYLWRSEEVQSVTSGRSKTTRSHEHFPCKDVSVAITWNGGDNKMKALSLLSSRSRAHHRQPSRCPHSQTLSSSSGAPTLEDVFLGNSTTSSFKSPCPPPRKSCSEWLGPCLDEELANLSCSESRNGSLSSIATTSGSSSSPSSWWWDGSSGCNAPAATAWGLVVVTAGLGGEIRAYQNFGLPIRL